MSQTTVYDHIAQATLDQYDLAQGQCWFLGHSGSVTFRIETRSLTEPPYSMSIEVGRPDAGFDPLEKEGSLR